MSLIHSLIFNYIDSVGFSQHLKVSVGDFNSNTQKTKQKKHNKEYLFACCSLDNTLQSNKEKTT